MSAKHLTVIVPCYNESAGLSALFARLNPVLGDLSGPAEILLVDDGSSDDTWATIQQLVAQNPVPVRALKLSRNFGKEAALSCGLHHADGEFVIMLDADLQEPPELIPDMLQAAANGADTVVAIRRRRDTDGFFKRVTAAAFYAVMRRTADVKITPQAGDFRLLSQRMVRALDQYPERSRFMKGLFASLGFKQVVVEFDREPRRKGKTKFGFWRLWNFALDGITSFSSLPLRVWGYVGAVLALISFVYASFIVIRTLMFGVDVPGYASLFTALLFFSGIQLLSIGILGEYIARLFVEVKARPLYLLDDSAGFEEAQLSRAQQRSPHSRA